MAPKEAPIRILRSDGIVHVDLLDSKLVDNTRIRQIGDELGALSGALVAVHKAVSSKKGQLRVVGVAPPVHDVLRYTGLTPLLEIHESTDKAIASMS